MYVANYYIVFKKSCYYETFLTDNVYTALNILHFCFTLFFYILLTVYKRLLESYNERYCDQSIGWRDKDQSYSPPQSLLRTHRTGLFDAVAEKFSKAQRTSKLIP